MSGVWELIKRRNCELAARRACAVIVARAFHKQRSQIRWQENRKARRAAEAAAKMAAPHDKAAEPLSPEEELADTIKRQKEAE